MGQGDWVAMVMIIIITIIMFLRITRKRKTTANTWVHPAWIEYENRTFKLVESTDYYSAYDTGGREPTLYMYYGADGQTFFSYDEPESQGEVIQGRESVRTDGPIIGGPWKGHRHGFVLRNGGQDVFEGPAPDFSEADRLAPFSRAIGNSALLSNKETPEETSARVAREIVDKNHESPIFKRFFEWKDDQNEK